MCWGAAAGSGGISRVCIYLGGRGVGLRARLHRRWGVAGGHRRAALLLPHGWMAGPVAAAAPWHRLLRNGNGTCPPTSHRPHPTRLQCSSTNRSVTFVAGWRPISATVICTAHALQTTRGLRPAWHRAGTHEEAVAPLHACVCQLVDLVVTLHVTGAVHAQLPAARGRGGGGVRARKGGGVKGLQGGTLRRPAAVGSGHRLAARRNLVAAGMLQACVTVAGWSLRQAREQLTARVWKWVQVQSQEEMQAGTTVAHAGARPHMHTHTHACAHSGNHTCACTHAHTHTHTQPSGMCSLHLPALPM